MLSCMQMKQTFLSNTKMPLKSFQCARQEIYNVTAWLAANKLLLNIEKTKYILFDSNQKKIANCSHMLLLDGKPIKQVKSILFLGYT